LQRCAQEKGVVPIVASRINPGFALLTDRRRQSELRPPTLNGSNCLRRFETGRSHYAIALSNYPSNCYGLAGGAIAGDASAAGDAMSLLAADAL
jgi:hypothetical protein